MSGWVRADFGLRAHWDRPRLSELIILPSLTFSTKDKDNDEDCFVGSVSQNRIEEGLVRGD